MRCAWCSPYSLTQVSAPAPDCSAPNVAVRRHSCLGRSTRSHCLTNTLDAAPHANKTRASIHHEVGEMRSRVWSSRCRTMSVESSEFHRWCCMAPRSRRTPDGPPREHARTGIGLAVIDFRCDSCAPHQLVGAGVAAALSLPNVASSPTQATQKEMCALARMHSSSVDIPLPSPPHPPPPFFLPPPTEFSRCPARFYGSHDGPW